MDPCIECNIVVTGRKQAFESDHQVFECVNDVFCDNYSVLIIPTHFLQDTIVVVDLTPLTIMVERSDRHTGTYGRSMLDGGPCYEY